jgi:two-component system NtrC family sensor kinase
VKKKSFFCFLFLFVFSGYGYCQRDIDSLWKLYDHEGADTSRIKLLLQIDSQYSLIDSAAKAFKVSNAALELARNAGNKSLLIVALNRTAITAITFYNHSYSMKLLLEALDLADTIHYAPEAAQTLMNMGIIFYDRKNFSNALSYFQQSYNLRRKLNNPNALTVSIYLIGLTYVEMGENKKALEYLHTANKMKEDFKDEKGIIEINIALARAFTQLNQFDSAQVYFEKAMNYCQSINDAVGVSYAGQYYAVLLFKEGRIDEALKMAINANSQVRTTIPEKDNLDLIKNIAEMYSVKNDWKNAYLYLEKYFHAFDSLKMVESTQELVFLRDNYHLEKSQEEIKLLTHEKKIQQLVKNVLIAGTLLLVLLAFVLWNRYQIKQRTSRQLEQMNTQLNATMNNLKATQSQLINHEKLAALGRITAGIAHEIQNPLNFVNNFSELSRDSIAELKESNAKAERDKILSELDDFLEKINKHGNRASSIVKSMLDHSRQSPGESELTDLNQLSDEYVNLSYYEMRARHSDFVCEIKKVMSADVPKIKIVRQEISRVLLNIAANAFHAMRLRKEGKWMHDENYHPEIRLETSILDNSIVICIIDNGTGIPEHIKEKIFEPFFTTKSTGEGTGLGLSISYDIVKSYNGEILVESEVGKGSSFKIIIPV